MIDRRKDLGFRLLDAEFGFFLGLPLSRAKRDLEGSVEEEWSAYANASTGR
jgi:hypothetical protein